MHLKQISTFVKIEHTLFALPFVFIGAFIAGNPTLEQLIWILVAAIGARGLAMGLNRIIDRDIDCCAGSTIFDRDLGWLSSCTINDRDISRRTGCRRRTDCTVWSDG